MPRKKTKTVKFLHSPSGKFNLAYNCGDEVDLPKNLAEEVVDAKYAVFVEKATSTTKE